jgi:hypothetical protein
MIFTIKAQRIAKASIFHKDVLPLSNHTIRGITRNGRIKKAKVSESEWFKKGRLLLSALVIAANSKTVTTITNRYVFIIFITLTYIFGPKTS